MKSKSLKKTKTKANTLTQVIPEHLLKYVVQQESTLYTPMDHASWRFILKVSQKFFTKYAHQKYLKGLRETGISTEHIPSILEMDRCLKKFKWRAVAVSGFIPPSIFMEFLSLGVLPIACDMRKIENIAYTPAPDIVHEAAGHAPIIADPSYADYLRSYGEISRKAVFSKADIDTYIAIRKLSEIKEDPRSTDVEIAAVQRQLDEATSQMKEPSEATLLARMGWWTFEYGLVGNQKNYKIYGAGLLSSLSESHHCIEPIVSKIPFSVDCIKTSYDITKPQPQLFVAKSFKELKGGLEDLAQTMAFKLGGVKALEIGKNAASLVTVELDSGLQITGKLIQYFHQNERVSFVKLSGPVQLSQNDREISGHGIWAHTDGFSSPLGKVKIKNKWKRTQDLTEKDLVNGQLEFESGILLSGKFIGLYQSGGKTLIVSFDDCKITKNGETLYRPEWGRFDLACGEKVVSVFGGAADRSTYPDPTEEDQKLKTTVVRRQKSNLTSENQSINQIYFQVRNLRENKNLKKSFVEKELESIYQKIKNSNEAALLNDWLIHYEILELARPFKNLKNLTQNLSADLNQLKNKSETYSTLIERGLECLN